MAFYLVSAVPMQELMEELSQLLAREASSIFVLSVGRCRVRSRVRVSGGTVSRFGRKRTIAVRLWRKNALPCSMTIFTMSVSSR